MSKGVISRGVSAPIIKEGDNIVDIVVDSILKETEVREGKGIYYDLNDRDIIGITESVVARSTGQYVTVDDITKDIIFKYGPASVINVINPIYSRNRFAMILKGIARAASKIVFTMPDYDEVGNPSGVNQFTGINIKDYYKQICENEGCEVLFFNDDTVNTPNKLYCGLHNYIGWKETHIPPIGRTDGVKCYTLADICSNVSPDWGLLGTNKATEEKLKLFPSKKEAQRVCDEIKNKLFEKTGVNVIVCVYGDGCFKDPVGGIWEFADPITMPAYTDKELMESTPNEIKLKAFIDQGISEESIQKLIDQKDKKLIGSMASQGTTPRLFRDLLASLMDLTSGSGDRATPIILIQNYFRS